MAAADATVLKDCVEMPGTSDSNLVPLVRACARLDEYATVWYAHLSRHLEDVDALLDCNRADGRVWTETFSEYAGEHGLDSMLHAVGCGVPAADVLA
ncbi:MAG: hypothetical protein BZ138_06510 [Methanosphaera sp. rholeuAM270]|nr:MAG: hypothetical protein BZ138_06510 [Methanosphaera sp. rholeuAM270]